MYKRQVERLKALVDGAQTVISRITGAGDSDDTSVEIFTMLSTQRAIWTYWRDVLYAWAGATTLDFAPLFFMVLLAIAYDRQSREQDDSPKAPALSPPLRDSIDQRWAPHR